VLAYLCKGETFAQFAAGFGIGRTTAWRYVNETVELLAARAPKLRKAVRDAKRAGHAYVILDGTLIPIDRVAADRPFYSGKHKKHGMNLQVIASPDGDVSCGSPARCPGPSTIKRPSGSGACSTSWRKLAWSPSRTRAIRAAPGRRFRTKAGTSRNRRKRPTKPTPSSARSAKGQTRSSRYGRSSASSAAARGAPGHSRRPSTYCSSARHNQVGISSVCQRLAVIASAGADVNVGAALATGAFVVPSVALGVFGGLYLHRRSQRLLIACTVIGVCYASALVAVVLPSPVRWLGALMLVAGLAACWSMWRAVPTK
jgi:Helix-turn-helix of DDE superfamily endonuclease/DDE superfamily endonuclease